MIRLSPLLVVFLCSGSGAEVRKAAEVGETGAPAVGAAATTVAASANPVTGLIVAGATLISALLRNNLKGE